MDFFKFFNRQSQQVEPDDKPAPLEGMVYDEIRLDAKTATAEDVLSVLGISSDNLADFEDTDEATRVSEWKSGQRKNGFYYRGIDSYRSEHVLRYGTDRGKESWPRGITTVFGGDDLFGRLLMDSETLLKLPKTPLKLMSDVFNIFSFGSFDAKSLRELNHMKQHDITDKSQAAYMRSEVRDGKFLMNIIPSDDNYDAVVFYKDDPDIVSMGLGDYFYVFKRDPSELFLGLMHHEGDEIVLTIPRRDLEPSLDSNIDHDGMDAE